MLNPNRSFVAYAVSFLLIFNVGFLPQLTDDHTATILLFMSSLIQLALTFVAYALLRFNLKRFKKMPSIWVQTLLLFLISVLVTFFTNGGRICSFGISYRYLNTTLFNNDSLRAFERLDLAFSVSLLVSAIIYLISQILYKKAVIQQEIINP